MTDSPARTLAPPTDAATTAAVVKFLRGWARDLQPGLHAMWLALAADEIESGRWKEETNG